MTTEEAPIVAGGSASDAREEWEDQARLDATRLANEDLSDEENAW